jgi:hypothetical protein
MIRLFIQSLYILHGIVTGMTVCIYCIVLPTGTTVCIYCMLLFTGKTVYIA